MVSAGYSFIIRPPLRFPPTAELAPSARGWRTGPLNCGTGGGGVGSQGVAGGRRVGGWRMAGRRSSAVHREGSELERGSDPLWFCPLGLQRRKDLPKVSQPFERQPRLEYDSPDSWPTAHCTPSSGCTYGPCSHPRFSNFLAFCAKHWAYFLGLLLNVMEFMVIRSWWAPSESLELEFL